MGTGPPTILLMTVGRSWDSDEEGGGSHVAVAAGTTRCSFGGWHTPPRHHHCPGRSWSRCRPPRPLRPPWPRAGCGIDIHGNGWRWHWRSLYLHRDHGRCQLQYPPPAVPTVLLLLMMTMGAGRTAADIAWTFAAAAAAAADHDRHVQAMTMTSAHRHHRRRRASSACWAIGGTFDVCALVSLAGYNSMQFNWHVLSSRVGKRYRTTQQRAKRSNSRAIGQGTWLAAGRSRSVHRAKGADPQRAGWSIPTTPKRHAARQIFIAREGRKAGNEREGWQDTGTPRR